MRPLKAARTANKKALQDSASVIIKMTGKIEKACAVIPAAGRGTRLGSHLPKLLTPVSGSATIWTLLSGRLLEVVEHINIIVSPEGEPVIRNAVERGGLSSRVSTSVQPAAIGMGDAIFRGFPVWSRARVIVIVWGDQAFVSENTLRKACTLHGGNSRTIVLPLVRLPAPYAEYVFADDGGLASVRQSREGNCCTPNGYADAGVFVLSVPHLRASWMTFPAAAARGALTREVNFLPFLPFLSSSGWCVKRLLVADPREARGINTPQDLEYLRSVIAAGQDTQ